MRLKLPQVARLLGVKSGSKTTNQRVGAQSLRKLERRENIGRFVGNFQFSQAWAALRKLVAV
jgi:hypothetical protein